ncbi:hypothetical protein ABZ896_17360 [Streptomyces sp. NPDC047072]|uniref:hypothetical protein n=1 Tax=Streptomyces sp. NPDC047072 TaxID=3154809 RepID=UPI0033CCB49E
MELVDVGVMLLVTGHETTAHMIALGMPVLLEHPDQPAALRAAPDTAGTAVEELLRHLSVIQFGAARYATEDVTVGGTAVKAGERLVAAIPSGNVRLRPAPVRRRATGPRRVAGHALHW